MLVAIRVVRVASRVASVIHSTCSRRWRGANASKVRRVAAGLLVLPR